MSTYKKNGARIIKIEDSKKVKKHLKEFYKSINEIRNIAQQLFLLEAEFNEDNINDYSRPFLGRELDSAEMFMLLGKIQSLRNET